MRMRLRAALATSLPMTRRCMPSLNAHRIVHTSSSDVRLPSPRKDPVMQRTASLIPQPATVTAPAPAQGARLSTWLHRVWENLTLDADEQFLRGASDLADMECRLRRLERGRAERFSPLHPDA